MELSTKLRSLLAEHRMNITQLSRAVNIPRQTLDNWVSGQEPRSLAQLKKVADYFEITVDELCFGQQIVRKIDEFTEEINAGVFEVVLRRVKK
jgi:transcriptional regulator with XRE-family HTH domain